MNTLEFKYLSENGFRSDGSKNAVSVVIENGSFTDGFKDEKQLSFIRTVFGDMLKYVSDMKIVVEVVNDLEYEVSLKWSYENGYGDIVDGESKIGGQDVYDLVSQAIVLARAGVL